MRYLKKFEEQFEEEYSDLIDNLFDAIYFGNYNEFLKLIDRDKELINSTNEDYTFNSPLLLAINGERYIIAEKLIELGANINFQNNNGMTPLMLAADNNYLDMITLLIDSGADWNIKDIWNKYFSII